MKSFQLYRDGQPVPGADGPSYVLTADDIAAEELQWRVEAEYDGRRVARLITVGVPVVHFRSASIAASSSVTAVGVKPNWTAPTVIATGDAEVTLDAGANRPSLQAPTVAAIGDGEVTIDAA